MQGFAFCLFTPIPLDEAIDRAFCNVLEVEFVAGDDLFRIEGMKSWDLDAMLFDVMLEELDPGPPEKAHELLWA